MESDDDQLQTIKPIPSILICKNKCNFINSNIKSNTDYDMFYHINYGTNSLNEFDNIPHDKIAQIKNQNDLQYNYNNYFYSFIDSGIKEFY